MTVRALSSTSVDLPIGGVWTLSVSVVDADGCVADDAPTVTVTLPAGSTTAPTVETITTGVYRATYVVGTAGRYIARVVADNGAAEFACYVNSTVAGTGMPTVLDLRNYLGADQYSWDDDILQDALDAEAAAQRRVCRVGATYPADLREALLRRVQRNLQMRSMPVGILTTSDGDTVVGTRIGRNDPEVARLEAPHRRLVVA